MQNRNAFQVMFVFLLGVFAAIASAAAQDLDPDDAGLKLDATTLISGRVRDASTGAVLPGVTVEIFDAETNIMASDEPATTGDRGDYQFIVADPNTLFNIAFSLPGYDIKEVTSFRAPAVVSVALLPSQPAAPLDLVALPGISMIRLRWTANRESNLSGYKVYRAEVVSGTAGTFGLISGTQLVKTPVFDDSTAVAGNTYQYRVVAVNSAARVSEYSNLTGKVKAGQALLTIPDMTGQPAKWLYIPIKVSNAEGLNISAADPVQIQLDYTGSSSIVDGFEACPTGLLPSTTAMQKGVDGSLALSFSSNGEMHGEGAIYMLYIKLKKPASGSTASQDVSITLFGGSSQIASARATFRLTSSTECTFVNHMQGDLADAFCSVDTDDVDASLDIAVGKLSPETWQVTAGDMNGDQFLDAADAVVIKRTALMLSSDSPAAATKLKISPPAFAPKIVMSLGAPAAVVTAGSAVEVPVSIDNAAGIAGATLTLTFPPELELPTEDAIVLGSGQNKAAQLAVNIGLQSVRVSIRQDTDMANGVLFTLNFQVAKFAEDGASLDLKFSNVCLSSKNGEKAEWFSTINSSQIASVKVSRPIPPLPDTEPVADTVEGESAASGSTNAGCCGFLKNTGAGSSGGDGRNGGLMLVGVLAAVLVSAGRFSRHSRRA